MVVKGQLGMDETVIEDEELEAALEAREKAKAQSTVMAKRFAEKHAIAKGLIEDRIPLGTVARIGRFRIERKPRPGRHVEFDSKDGVTVSIREDGDD